MLNYKNDSNLCFQIARVGQALTIALIYTMQI